jgi:hypothetical protein
MRLSSRSPARALAFAAACAALLATTGCYDTAVLDESTSVPDAAGTGGTQNSDAGVPCPDAACGVCRNDEDCPLGQRCDHDGARCRADNRGPGNSDDARER